MKAVLAGLLVLALIGCQKSEKFTDSTPREKIDVADTVYLKSGVKYLFVKKSQDTVTVKPGHRITTQVNLYINEKLIWTTYEPLMPFIFLYQVDRNIPGFDEVLQYMHRGDRIIAIIPPSLAYGASGSGADIPPNSVLTFDIEVAEVREIVKAPTRRR